MGVHNILGVCGAPAPWSVGHELQQVAVRLPCLPLLTVCANTCRLSRCYLSVQEAYVGLEQVSAALSARFRPSPRPRCSAL